MWANEWTRPHFIDRIYSLSCESFYMADNGTRQHYVTLPGRTASYGGRIQSKITVTYALTRQTDPGFFLEIKFKGGKLLLWGEKIWEHPKNKQNLLLFWGGNLKLSPPKGPAKNTELTTDGCCTLRRMALKHYKMPRRPFSKLCSNLLCTYCLNELPEWGPTIAWLCVLSIMPLWAWAHRRSAYAQLYLYICSTLHVTHVIKYTRPSPAFSHCKRRKGQGLGTRLMISCINYFLSALLLSHQPMYLHPSKSYTGTKCKTRDAAWTMHYSD